MWVATFVVVVVVDVVIVVIVRLCGSTLVRPHAIDYDSIDYHRIASLESNESGIPSLESPESPQEVESRKIDSESLNQITTHLLQAGPSCHAALRTWNSTI